MSEQTAKLVDKAKRVLERGCPHDENHFMRVEIATDESFCRIWCPDCGYETRVDPDPDPADFVGTTCAECGDRIVVAPSRNILGDLSFCTISCKCNYMEKLLSGGSDVKNQ